MARIALGIEYCGTGYQGWQLQVRPDPPATVQGSLQESLSSIANHAVTVFCAGRTDSGVHATGQVVHFDSSVQRPDRAWVQGTNSRLPDNIRVLWAKPVADEFHARHSALSRSYLYVTCNTPIRPASLQHSATWTPGPLDDQAMHLAAQHLVGEHDFSGFRAAGCESSTPMRRVFQTSVERRGDLILFRVQANAFLLHMVRNMMGSLRRVGQGTHPPEWIHELLSQRDRRLAGATARPEGLYLVRVGYPLQYGLPEVGMDPWFLNSASSSQVPIC